jgi:hypothetical protein
MIGKEVNRGCFGQQGVFQFSGMSARESPGDEFHRLLQEDKSGRTNNASGVTSEKHDRGMEADNNVISYFRQATGIISGRTLKNRRGTDEEPSGKQGGQNEFDPDDYTQFSPESQEDIQESVMEENEDPFEVFQNAHPIGRTDFLSSLGIKRPEETFNNRLSLADKLEQISRKTAGKGFE